MKYMVKIIDETEYISGSECNGGNYRYWETFTQQDNGMYMIRYSYSGDHMMCPNCGNYMFHQDHFKSEACKPELITEAEVKKRIDNVANLPDWYVSIHCF